MTITVNERRLTSVVPADSEQWAEVARAFKPSLFHSAPWMRAIRDTYGFNFYASVLSNGGRPRAGVLWHEMNGITGHRRITLPFSDYCDPLISDASGAFALLNGAWDRRSHWAMRMMADTAAKMPPSVRQGPSHKWHGIPLSVSSAEAWDRFTPMAQRAIRKSQKEGVQVTEARTRDQLRSWYLLHLRLRKGKHRLLAQPFSFFERIWDHFMDRDQGFLLIAEHGGRLIGGTLYLISEDVCYYKFNASDPEFLGLRPNNLLLWEGVVRATERKARMLDLGRSPLSLPGLISFKKSFGSVETDICSVTLGTEERAPSVQDARRLLHQLTELFVHDDVPDSLTERAGGILYQYFA